MTACRLFLLGLAGCLSSICLVRGSNEVNSSSITMFLCGDVMTGRGVDQILPNPCAPRIHESYVKDARGYVALTEQASGPIAYPVDYSYIWGDALDELELVDPDVCIINLETSVTGSDDYWRGKGIHYRMNPKNISCITAAGIDCCVLANNHVLDWGYAGLTETLDTLRQAGIRYAGAGENAADAAAPAVLELEGKGRVIVFACGHGSSGVSGAWAAGKNRAGVNLLDAFSGAAVQRIKEQVAAVKRPRDVVVVSIHWGGNWGYKVPDGHRTFAHRLIDEAGVDLIHGHSSHHAKGLEVYKNRLILYGCGDFLNDYEGIGGYESFRSDLVLMYFPCIDPETGKLAALRMVPMRMNKFRLKRASQADTQWMRETLMRKAGVYGGRLGAVDEGRLSLVWE